MQEQEHLAGVDARGVQYRFVDERGRVLDRARSGLR